jgi:superoxide dismutase, Fe-Mn family
VSFAESGGTGQDDRGSFSCLTTPLLTFRMTLVRDFGALEPYYSAEMLELHHDKHHAGYVAGANTTIEKLADARERGDFGAMVGLEKALAFNGSGHILHSTFWKNLSPDRGDKPDGDLAAAVDEHFGSFVAFKDRLTQVTATIQGSGWGVLAWEPLGQRLLIEQGYHHQGNVGQGSVPLLVFDAWEHAFYLQYKNVKADYVSALWNIVNWSDVTRRLFEARSLSIF